MKRRTAKSDRGPEDHRLVGGAEPHEWVCRAGFRQRALAEISCCPESLLLRTLRTWLILTGLVFLIGPGRAQTTESDYQQRVKILENLGWVITWPPEALGGPKDPFKIGLFVPDDLTNAFSSLKSVRGHPVVLLKPQTVKEAHECQLIYVAEVRQGDARKILVQLTSESIVIIGENEEFAKELGTLAIIAKINKTAKAYDFYYRYKVNLSAAAQHHLQFNPHFINSRAVDQL